MKKSLSRRTFVGAAIGSALIGPEAIASISPLIAGINISGLEFSSSKLPGKVNYDYVGVNPAELSYYHSRGAKAFRLPFLWERVQPVVGGPLDANYVALIDAAVNQAHNLRMNIVLDAHQYGRRKYNGQSYIIGATNTIKSTHFSQMWSLLAARYRAHSGVIFNLINEPHDQDKTTLVSVQNAAIAAIRATGATQLILASGSSWSGAWTWVSSGNGAAMLNIHDPANNYAFDVHQYLDSNGSGTSGTCATNSGTRLAAFTTWAKQNKKRGFLGEFAGGANSACNTDVSGLLSHIASNRDVWLGWTAWGGGAWWGNSYPFVLKPASLSNPVDRPQMATLRRYWA